MVAGSVPNAPSLFPIFATLDPALADASEMLKSRDWRPSSKRLITCLESS